ncbi:hypothetical protein BGZ65_005551 [Modicella reniformis]|uniref:Pseudouridine synthase RsuA/RluA-like domain-containing protein n=1 Tax=Modicella reniformis TaxID=1440133 RepID=A0A9P6M8K0_9FUNG|nr:hypothetical protein BGZ65_005551 [Modicella reniformis]
MADSNFTKIQESTSLSSGTLLTEESIDQLESLSAGSSASSPKQQTQGQKEATSITETIQQEEEAAAGNPIETDLTATTIITTTTTTTPLHLQGGSKRQKESNHGHYDNQQQTKKQKKRLDLVNTEDDLCNAEYYFENDLRKIKPYFFKYQTFAKGRWLGRRIIDVFNTEFRDRDNTFYEHAISDGRVKINGEKVSTDYIIKNSDIVAHDIHRHEPPVANLPVKVVWEDDSVIIVDKPSTVNRLDRLTSGLMIIALSAKRAREFEFMMQKCEIKKEYVCKVKGQFPSGITECHEPIHVASFKLTLNTVHPDGKSCSTIFELSRYDPISETSIVFARPITGRTHQIRVHLQWLGYPITNDPLYHNKDIWGERNGQGGVSEEMEKELVQKLLERGEMEDEVDYELATVAVAAANVVNNALIDSNNNNNNTPTPGQGQPEFCQICRLPSRADPEPKKRIMYLHAWKYRAKDWSFQTELPDWAKEGLPSDSVSIATTATTAAKEKE